MIYFFDTCVHLIRTLPTMQHDDMRPEDLDSEAEDHAVDSLRYAVMARPWVRQAPKPAPVKFAQSTQMTVTELIEQRRRARIGDD